MRPLPQTAIINLIASPHRGTKMRRTDGFTPVRQPHYEGSRRGHQALIVFHGPDGTTTPVYAIGYKGYGPRLDLAWGVRSTIAGAREAAWHMIHHATGDVAMASQLAPLLGESLLRTFRASWSISANELDHAIRLASEERAKRLESETKRPA